MTAKSLLFDAVSASAATSVQAQCNDTTNVLGTVEKVDATYISVKDDDAGGAVESFQFAAKVLVTRRHR